MMPSRRRDSRPRLASVLLMMRDDQGDRMGDAVGEQGGSASGIRPFTMVVGGDLDPANEYAFDQGVRMALRIPRSHLHVVHVAPEDTTEAETHRLAGMLRLYIEARCTAEACSGQSVGIHVRRGDPAREVVQLAADVAADLIMVGRRTHVHLREFLEGALAIRLVRSAPCPVVVAEPVPEATDPREPAVGPPCPNCVALRARSRGTQWWCARHAEQMRRAHHYSYQNDLPYASTPRSLRGERISEPAASCQPKRWV